MQIILTVLAVVLTLELLKTIAKYFGYWDMVQYTILEIEAIAVSAVFCIAILTWDMILTAILYAVACALTPLSFTIQGVIYSIALVKCIEIMYRTAKKNRIKVLSVENTDADIFDTEIADEFDKLNQKL